MVPTTEVLVESDISNNNDSIDNDNHDDNTDEDIGRVNIQYSPENNIQADTSSTYFKGGQIYSPMWRKISSQTAMKDLSSLSKFPECLKHYIWPLRDGFSPGNGVPHQILRSQTHQMFDRVTEAFNRFQDNLNQFGCIPVRVELFTRYDPSRDYKVKEKIDDLPDFVSVIKKHRINLVRKALRKKSLKLYAPIDALMEYDRGRHKHDARPPVFFPFGNREVLASVVICAEQLNAVTGICWAGPYSKREMANYTQIKDKVGGITVREVMLEPCSDEVKQNTKLEKTVRMSIMLQNQPDTFRQGMLDFKGRLVPAWMYRQAENLKKNCHYPILYVASAARIESCLQQLSANPNWDIDTGQNHKDGWCDWDIIKYDVIAGMEVDKIQELLVFLAKEMIQVYYHFGVWEMNRKQKKQEKQTTNLTTEQTVMIQSKFTENSFPVTLADYNKWDRTRQYNDATKDYNFKFLKLKKPVPFFDEGRHQDVYIVRDFVVLFSKMFGSENDIETSHTKSPTWKLARDVESVIMKLQRHALALSYADNENDEATANLKLLQCPSHFKKLIAKQLLVYATKKSEDAESDEDEFTEDDEEDEITPLIFNVWKKKYRSQFGELLPVQIYSSQLEMSTYEVRMLDQALSNSEVMERDNTNLIAIQLSNMKKDSTCMESESEDNDEMSISQTKIIESSPFTVKHDVRILMLYFRHELYSFNLTIFLSYCSCSLIW
jgi:hypothetical protein